MSAPQGGSADEVRALLTALTEWVQRAMPAPPSGHPGPECQWCPLCQFASALRGERPEITERIVETGAAVTGALRTLLDPSGSAGTDEHAPDVERPAGQARREPGSRPRPRLVRDEPDGTH